LADQSFGLIPHAPVDLLWVAGLWVAFRKNPRLGCELLLLVAPYSIASSAYGMWWAGDSSPARLLVPIVFPLGITVAGVWAGQSGRGRAMSLTLLGASLMIATALAFGGRGGLPQRHDGPRAMARLGGTARGSFARFPSFFEGRRP
jgi:hypothetical protein